MKYLFPYWSGEHGSVNAGHTLRLLLQFNNADAMQAVFEVNSHRSHVPQPQLIPRPRILRRRWACLTNLPVIKPLKHAEMWCRRTSASCL